MFRLRPPDLNDFTGQQIRELADRIDQIIEAANRSAEQIEGP